MNWGEKKTELSRSLNWGCNLKRSVPELEWSWMFVEIFDRFDCFWNYNIYNVGKGYLNSASMLIRRGPLKILAPKKKIARDASVFILVV